MAYTPTKRYERWFARQRLTEDTVETTGSGSPLTQSTEDFTDPSAPIPATVPQPVGQNTFRPVNFYTMVDHPIPEPVKKMKPEKRTDPFQDKYPSPDWRVWNSPTAFKVTHLMCCGVKELHGIQSRVWQFYRQGDETYKSEPQSIPDTFMDMRKEYMDTVRHRPFWIFTDNNLKQDVGAKIADYIEANGLGTVWRSGRIMNENSANKIEMYVWTVDKKAVHAFNPNPAAEAA